MSACCSGIGDLLSVICLTLAGLVGAVDVHDLYLLVALAKGAGRADQIPGVGHAQNSSLVERAGLGKFN